MFRTVAKGKAIIIRGDVGVGKSALANVIADYNGTKKSIIDEGILKNFGLSFLADTSPDTVIVEDFDDWDTVKDLATAQTLTIPVKYKDPVEVKAPHFIFTTSNKEPLKLPHDSRRFYVIDLKG